MNPDWTEEMIAAYELQRFADQQKIEDAIAASAARRAALIEEERIAFENRV